MKTVNSITLNNKKLSDLNVGWRTVSRPTSPQKKAFLYSSSAMDGEYDFSSYNPENRPHYEAMELSGEIMIVNEVDIAASQLKLRQVMKLVHGTFGRKMDLVFDDTPDRIYRVAFQDSSAITSYDNRKNIILTVTFKADPFPHSKKVSRVLSVNGYTEVTPEIGSFFTKPKFSAVGSFSAFYIQDIATGKRLDIAVPTYSGSGALVIDFDTESVHRGNQSMDYLTRGDFWEFNPASHNRFTIGAVGTATVTMEYLLLELY